MVWAMRTAAIVFAALSWISLPISPDARADTARAWSAAKAGLPADAKVVFAVDVAGLQKTQLFAALWPRLLERFDATKLLDAIKTDCKIDPLVAVQGVVVGLSDGQEGGAAYVAITGLDRPKLSACLRRELAREADKGAKITVKNDGNITEVTDGKDSLFVGWASKDVVVVPLQIQDRATLVRWMSGKGALAKAPVTRRLARVNTAAALWGAGVGEKEVQPGVTVTGGYGAVALAKGNVDADVHAVVQSGAQAKTMAESVHKQLDDARQAPILPPSLATVLRAVTIEPTNDEVVIKASVGEGDLVAALSLALGAL